MAAVFLQAKDFVQSKLTPDCLKASADELKTFAKDAKGKFKGEIFHKRDKSNVDLSVNILALNRNIFE